MSSVKRWGVLQRLDATRDPLPWPERMLIVGPVGLGDALVALPALRRVQRASPGTHLTWIGRAAYRPIAMMMGAQDFCASDDPACLAGRHFDAIVSFPDIGADFLGSAKRVNAIPIRVGRAAARVRPRWFNQLVHTSRWGWPRHEAQRHLRLLLPFGHGAAASPNELLGDRPLGPAPATLPDDLPAKGHVVLHPFSMGHGREWPMQHWIDTAQMLTSDNVPVVITGSPAESVRLAHAWPPAQRPAGVIDASGRLDIAQLSLLLHRARSVAACSTGPLHLAAALGTPTLGLYAPRKGVALDRWAPLGVAAVAVQAQHRCPHGRRCDNGACACMVALASQRVAAALRTDLPTALTLAPLAPYVHSLPPRGAVPAATETAVSGAT